MGLVELLVIVIIFGVLFWLLTNVIPMPPAFKITAQVILALILIVVLLDGVHLGHVRFLR